LKKISSFRRFIEYAVKGSENITDILARWEIEKRNSFVESKYQTIRKGEAPVQAVGGGEAKFYLKRRIFKTPQKIPTDPVEYHLIYAQAMRGVLDGDYPVTEQPAVRLGALKAQVDWGDYDSTVQGRLNDLTNYLPPKFINEKPKQEWVDQINAIHQKLAGKSVLQAKVLYLEAVKQFPMYGATFFPAVYKGFWAFANNLLIAVHVDGLAWIHHKTKAVMKSYSYDRLASWELDHNVVTLNFTSEPTDPDGDHIKCEFQCDQSEEVVNLIKEYSPNHRHGVTKEEKEAKRRQELDISEAELGALGLELERCRQKLLDAQLLRIPGPDSSNTGGSKFGTLQTIKKLTIRRSIAADDKKKAGNTDYTLADWAFSKVCIRINKIKFFF